MRLTVQGIIPDIDGVFEIIMVKVSLKENGKNRSFNVSLRYESPMVMRAYNRQENQVDFVNLHWNKLMQKVLKYKGYK